MEDLIKANGIAKTIDKLEAEKSRLSKLYAKTKPLTEEELKEIFQIAMVNTDYTLKKFKEELNNL